MMFKYMMLLFLSTSFLFGCSSTTTQQSQQTNIRSEFLNDSKGLYTIINTDFTDAKTPSDGDLQKMNIFVEKYKSVKDLNNAEKKLFDSMMKMIQAEMNEQIGKGMSDESKRDEAINQYLEGSKSVKEILNSK